VGGDNEDGSSGHLRTEEQKPYDTYGKNSVVLSAHPSADLGIDATRTRVADGISERNPRVADRKRQTRPYGRERACVPGDFRNTPSSDVSSRL
jgi:hypothetical protein